MQRYTLPSLSGIQEVPVGNRCVIEPEPDTHLPLLRRPPLGGDGVPICCARDRRLTAPARTAGGGGAGATAAADVHRAHARVHAHRKTMPACGARLGCRYLASCLTSTRRPA